MEIAKAYEITDAKIQFVSLVDKAANMKRFLITKAENGEAAFTSYGRIIKKDKQNHFVTGIVYEPLAEDAHGNYMTEQEITKAAYYFAKSGNKIDLQHSFEPLEGATVVESWIAKSDFVMEGSTEPIKKGTWLMTVEVTDEDIWKAIENKEITGFSMGGVGSYSKEDVQLNNSADTEKTSIFKKFASMFGFDVVEKKAPDEVTEDESQSNAIEKAGKKISGANREKLQGAYETLGALLEQFADPDPDEKKKDEEMEQSGTDDGKAAASPKGEAEEQPDTEHTPKPKEKEEKNLTKSEVEKMISETVADAVNKAFEAQQSATAETEIESVEAVLEEEVQKMVTKAVEEAIEPLLKTRGLSAQINGDNTKPVVKEQHYLHGIL